MPNEQVGSRRKVLVDVEQRCSSNSLSADEGNLTVRAVRAAESCLETQRLAQRREQSAFLKEN